jgi:hemolysin activation/secretion protein
LLLSGTANSFTSAGERTELDLFDTPFDDEQLFAQLSVSALVGSEGLELRGYAGYGLTSPGDVLRNIGYKGRLNTGGIAADYPLIRSRALTLQLTSNFDIFQSEIDLFGPTGLRAREADSRLRVLRLGGNLTYQDTLLGDSRGGATTVTLQAHKALDLFHASANDAQLLPRPGTISDFLKYTGEIIRVQDLFSIDDYHVALKLAVAGQWTRSILPSSEEFFLGGNQYGRGFFSGEVTGDRALAETAELQVTSSIPNIITWFDDQPPDIGLRYYGFFDNGEVWNRTAATPPQTVKSAGIGVKAVPYPGYSVTIEEDNRFTLRPAGGTAVSRLTPRVLIIEAAVQF